MKKNKQQEYAEIEAASELNFAKVRADLATIGSGNYKNAPIEAYVRLEANLMRIKFTFLSQARAGVAILQQKGYVLKRQSGNKHEYNVITVGAVATT